VAGGRRERWGRAAAGLGLALAGIAVGVVTLGDTGDDIPATPSPPPADYVGYDAPADGAIDFLPGAASLTGPHFAVAFATLQVSADSGDGFRATAGHEFLRLSPRPTSTTTAPVPAQVVVDGAAHPVDLSRVARTGLVVSVPTGHSATLQVVDAGRTQALDLRTGRAGPDAAVGYYRQATLRWAEYGYSGAGESEVDGCRRRTTFQLHIAGTEAAVLPWEPQVGWAAPGRAWVPIPYSTLPPVSDQQPGCPDDPRIGWDVDGSVGLRTPLRETAPARVLPANGGDGGTLLFDVPVSLPGAVLVVHPAATWDDGAGRQPVKWTTPPETAETEMAADRSPPS
jgi:hypothetical protein